MMSELLPCPFCGGEVRITLHGDEFGCCWWQVSRGTDNATACHCRLFMESDRKWQVNDGDEPEDYPLASAEKRWLIEKWNTRVERTCNLIERSSLANWPDMVCWSCSVCGFGWHHSRNDKQFSYCPNCGAKVNGVDRFNDKLAPENVVTSDSVCSNTEFMDSRAKYDEGLA